MMAASKPTSSQAVQRHILSTQSHLGTLADGLGCYPLGNEPYRPLPDCCDTEIHGIRSLIGFGNLVGSLSHSVLYLQGVLPQHSPSSDFGENQLSRGLISLSLLLSSHLRIFQHSRVRSSTACYCSFNLLKSRSPPLRVYCPRLGRAVNTRFPFASTAKRFRLATDNNSQTHYAKGKQSPRPFYVHCSASRLRCWAQNGRGSYTL